MQNVQKIKTIYEICKIICMICDFSVLGVFPDYMQNIQKIYMQIFQNRRIENQYAEYALPTMLMGTCPGTWMEDSD